MTTDRLTPGHVLPLCRGCAHQTSDLSHPSPCRMVRWQGPRHVAPALVADASGVPTCADFQAVAPEVRA